MNKPAEKNQDAEDARNVAILRERMTAEVEGLREGPCSVDRGEHAAPHRRGSFNRYARNRL
jgi:hypothetical protein